MSDEAPLLDFPGLLRRLRLVGVVLGVGAAAGAVVEVALGQAAGPAILRWATAAVAAALLATAALAAVQAYRAAQEARRRGRRLSGDDVGLAPPRQPRDPFDADAT